MTYRYKATEEFWRAFHALPSKDKEAVRRAWTLFRDDPFDPRLGTHRIHSLSARAGVTVYSVVVTRRLRAVFCIAGDTVTTLDLGTHAVYR